MKPLRDKIPLFIHQHPASIVAKTPFFHQSFCNRNAPQGFDGIEVNFLKDKGAAHVLKLQEKLELCQFLPVRGRAEKRSMTEKTGINSHFVTNFSPKSTCFGHNYDKLTPKSRKGKLA
jgi:hypothetical protein